MSDLSETAKLILKNKHNGRPATWSITTRHDWRLAHMALVELEARGLITDDHPQVILTPAGKLMAIELFGKVESNGKI